VSSAVAGCGPAPTGWQYLRVAERTNETVGRERPSTDRSVAVIIGCAECCLPAEDKAYAETGEPLATPIDPVPSAPPLFVHASGRLA
jgi:hypothetical protein